MYIESMGNNNLTQVGESEHQIQSFEPIIKSPCRSILTPLETTAAIKAKKMSFQTQQHNHDHYPIDDIPFWSNEFPTTTTDPPSLFCQASQDNYSANNNTSQFTAGSLQSVAEAFVSSSEDSISSSEKYSEFPSCSGKYGNFLYENNKTQFCTEHFPQGNKNVLEGDAAPAQDQGSREISFQRNQWDSCTKPDKQSSPCGFAFATSSKSESSRTATCKRRIRWTKDLNETFVTIVNRLGGPEKAKPKAILEMMGSDVLTITHVKSHLQKYRSTLPMHKALEGRSDEGHITDGINELQIKIQMQIEETQQLQLEVLRSNHQQLEMQRNLQLIIERQRKQLKLMLDQQKQRAKLDKIPDSERN